jgi:WD40 repeat protein
MQSPVKSASISAMAACCAVAALSLGSHAARAQPFVAPRTAQCVAFSHDGKLLATGKSGQSNDAEPLRPHPSPRKCAEIELYDGETFDKLRRIESYGDLTSLAFSRDGKLLAAARLFRTIDGVDLNAVILWNVETGEVARTFERTHAFDFSPDGKSILVASQRSCTSFDLATGERQNSFKPLGGALAVKYSPDEKQLFGIMRGDDGYKIVSCSLASGDQVAASLALDEPFYNLDVSRDGKLVCSGHDAGNVLLWKAETLEPDKRLQAGVEDRQRALFSPDGTAVACCGQTKADVVLFDVTNGREQRRLHFDKGSFTTYMRRSADEKVRPESDPQRFAFSPDGSLFFAGCYGGILRSLESGNEVRRLGE